MNKFKKVLLVIFAAVTVFAVSIAAGCSNSKKLQALHVDTTGAETAFIVGQDFSAEGLVVTADLGKSETEIAETVTLNASEYTVDSSAYNKNEVGTYTIKVSYKLKKVTLEQAYDVTVAEPTFDGLEVTLAEGVEDTINLSAEATTAVIDVSKIVVKEVNPATGIVKDEITDYSVALYKGAEKIELTDNKATVGGGAYQIWVSKASTVNQDFTRESFVNIFVINDLASIAIEDGAKLTQAAGADTISSTWKFTAVYASGATKALTIDDVTVEGLDTKTVAEAAKATVSYTDVNAKGTEVTKTTEVTYTITAASGTSTVTVSANISTLVTDGVLTANNTATTSEITLADGISVLPNVQIDENKKSIDGFSFTHRLKLGGAGSATTRSIKLVTAGAAKVVVYMQSGSGSADRPVGLFVADSSVTEGNVGLGIIEGSSQTSLGASIAKFEYTITEAGTYYLASLSGGVNVYYIAVETTIEGGSSEVTPVSADIGALVNAGTLSAATLTSETALADGISVLSNSEKTVAIDANSKSIDGFSFTHRLKLSGAGSAATRSIKLVTAGAAKITVYMMSSSSTDARSVGLYVADSSVTEGNAGLKLIDNTAQTVEGSAIAKYEYTVSEAGTYYLAALTGGTNVYYIAVEPQA